MVRPVMHKEDLQEKVLLLPRVECQPPSAVAGQGFPVGKGWSIKASRMFPVPQTSPAAGLGRAGGWLGQAGPCYSQSQVPEFVTAPQLHMKRFFLRGLGGLSGIHFWQLLPSDEETSYGYPGCEASKMPPHHN